jgi:hypothetical protein
VHNRTASAGLLIAFMALAALVGVHQSHALDAAPHNSSSISHGREPQASHPASNARIEVLKPTLKRVKPRTTTFGDRIDTAGMFIPPAEWQRTIVPSDFRGRIDNASSGYAGRAPPSR